MKKNEIFIPSVNSTGPLNRDREMFETDFEVRSLDTICLNESEKQHPLWYNLKYALVGVIFGIVFVKSEIISWFRIQEMFKLQSFHMYGLIGTAVITGMISIFLIKKFNIKTIDGKPIVIPKKKFNWGYVIGGFLFGTGWAFSGACPGPLLALIGAGNFVVIVVFLSALMGTLVYSWLRPRLPH